MAVGLVKYLLKDVLLKSDENEIGLDGIQNDRKKRKSIVEP